MRHISILFYINITSIIKCYKNKQFFRPLSKGVSKKLGDMYLELPSDCRHLYHLHRSPTPIHWECKSVLEPKTKHLGQFYSTGKHINVFLIFTYNAFDQSNT